MKINRLIVLLLTVITTTSFAAQIKIKMYQLGKNKQYIGSVIAKDTPYGLLLLPDLKNLSPGIHGFHLHTNKSCANHGLAAGGHLDPLKTGKHRGPYSDKGHLGDLPVLYVNNKGIANIPELTPRLSVAQIRGRSLMIPEGGDTYSDKPTRSGGGGAHVACGVIG
jgi:Cu-Zn family superoxide dismutase